jgi:type VI secretion system protein VasD
MRLIHILVVFIVAFSLAACAGRDSNPRAARVPIRLELSLVASSDVNPDDQKRAAPIVVRVYELKTDATFNAADYFSLQDKDKTVLVDDLVARDQFQLRPGEQTVIRRTIDPATTRLGILPAYRDLPNAVWRVTYSLPVAPEAAWYWRSPKLKLIADLGAKAVSVTESK